MSAIEEYRLENGLLLLMQVNRRAPVIALAVAYRAGSKYERPGYTGMSHLLEHMMFKSTLDYGDGEFDRRLTLVGAEYNAQTWLDETVYYETVAADRIEVALELEAIRMRRLALSPEELATEKTVVLNELAQRDDNPGSYLYENFIATAFRAHPYMWPTIGWREDVERITADDLRAHYDRFYQPDNAFIVAVGDFEPDAMRALAERYFGGIPESGCEPSRPPAEPVQQAQQRLLLKRSGDTDYLLMGWHVPANTHPDSYALVVAGNILGGGRTSRLFSALIDSGKATAISAGSSAFTYAEPFLFLAGATVGQETSPEEVESAIVAEIARLAEEGPQEDELARARKQARVSFIYDRDAMEAGLSTIASFEVGSSHKRIDEYLPGVEAVIAQDVQRVAGAYLTEDNSTVGYCLGAGKRRGSSE